MSNQPMEQQKAVATNKLTKLNDAYLPMITDQLETNNIQMNQYQRQCVMNAIASINELLDNNGVDWNNPQLDKSNLTETMLNVATLQLNPAAQPREVYFILRNKKLKDPADNSKDKWVKKIETGIEGDGNDALLARFGRGVKDVKGHWLVRENDHFTYPMFKGLEMQPPEWQPTGEGKVVRVVYPIIKHDDTVEYYWAEREDVKANLIAHIQNAMMNTTFGMAESMYKATPDKKKQINEKKRAIIEEAKAKTLDGILEAEDAAFYEFISPAWKEAHSREAMLIRKMRNNIVKKIPKDFGHNFVAETFSKEVDKDEEVQEEITQRMASESFDDPSNNTIDGDYEEIPNDEKEPEPEKSKQKTDDEISSFEQFEREGQNSKGGTPF